MTHSHGAAMKSALLSPKFRLQTKFDIVDNCIYPIKITWDTAEGSGYVKSVSYLLVVLVGSLSVPTTL